MAESKITIDATKLKVYPCSTRTDENDLNAKLNSEQNIVSVINRLTNNSQAFVIGQLKQNQGGPNKDLVISPFEVNIFGYLFNILENITFSYSVLTDKTKIIAYIKTETITIGNTSFEQLKPNIEVDTNIDDLASEPFKPLTISAVDETTYNAIVNTSGVKCLVLLEKQTPFEYWANSAFATIPFRVQDIGIDIKDIHIATQHIIDPSYKHKQSLYDWLISNYTIDDGNLDE